MNHLINQAANLISGAFDFLVLSLTRLIGSYFYGFDRKCRLIWMTEMTDCRGRGDPGGDRDTVFSTEIQNHRKRYRKSECSSHQGVRQRWAN